MGDDKKSIISPGTIVNNMSTMLSPDKLVLFDRSKSGHAKLIAVLSQMDCVAVKYKKSTVQDIVVTSQPTGEQFFEKLTSTFTTTPSKEFVVNVDTVSRLETRVVAEIPRDFYRVEKKSDKPRKTKEKKTIEEESPQNTSGESSQDEEVPSTSRGRRKKNIEEERQDESTPDRDSSP